MNRIFQYLLVIAIVFSSIGIKAQHAGFKIGVNFANMTIKPDEDVDNFFINKRVLISPKLGFIFETSIYEGLFFQTGVNTSVKGFKFDGTRLLQTGTDEDNKPIVEEFESIEYFVFWYISLPLQFGYKFDLGDVKLLAMTGPEFNYGVYSTNLYKANNEYDNDHYTTGSDPADDYKPFDIHWSLEGGVQYSRFQFTVYYTYGLSNVVNVSDGMDDVSWKNRVFGANIAILFGQMDKSKNRYFRR